MATNVHWHNSHVTRSDRERNLKQRGVTVSVLFCIGKAHRKHKDNASSPFPYSALSTHHPLFFHTPYDVFVE